MRLAAPSISRAGFGTSAPGTSRELSPQRLREALVPVAGARSRTLGTCRVVLAVSVPAPPPAYGQVARLLWLTIRFGALRLPGQVFADAELHQSDRAGARSTPTERQRSLASN